MASRNAPKTSSNSSESDFSWSWSKFAKACRFTRQTPPPGMSTASSKRTSWTQLFVSAKRLTWLRSGGAHGSTVSSSPSESPDSISTKFTSSTPPSRSRSGASGTVSRKGISQTFCRLLPGIRALRCHRQWSRAWRRITWKRLMHVLLMHRPQFKNLSNKSSKICHMISLLLFLCADLPPRGQPGVLGIKCPPASQLSQNFFALDTQSPSEKTLRLIT